MKLRSCIFLLALIAGVFLSLALQQANAQDTLSVQWKDAGGNVIPNALYNAFVGDTINRPSGRVYKLLKGGYYNNTSTIDNNGRPLRLVGEAAGPTALENPPVIQMFQVAGTTSRMLTVQNDLVLRNLWITGANDLGDQTSYQQIQVDGSGYRIIVDNCIFDRSNFAIIAFQGGSNNRIYFTNNKFRNLIGRPSTQQWEGRGVSIWANQDTVVIENNTFFNVEFTPFQMESGAIKYLRFNHNTMVNVGRTFAGAWWREAYFANNLWINPFWHGEGIADVTSSGRDARQWQSGIFGIGPLPSVYGPEEGRRILFGFNAAWRDPSFSPSGYYADTTRPQFFVGDVTRLDFRPRGVTPPYPNIVIRDTQWVGTRPNVMTFGNPDTLKPKMWANITDLRRQITPATPWFYNLPFISGFGECFTCVDWPLPDNFSYNTPANLLTAGTDHLPLGDLNWFPTQKALFLANRTAFIDTLQSYAGPVVTLTPSNNTQLESGVLSNGATVRTVQGFTYFQMDGGGSFTWTFNVATAGPRNLRVLTHMRNNNPRGEHTRFNGTAIHDSSFGYGELIWSSNPDGGSGFPNSNAGMPLNEWTWSKFAVSDIKMADRPAMNLSAGSNTLQIASSWGFQNFSEVHLGMGADTIRLKAPDVSNYVIVAPRTDPVQPWVPSYFKSVALGTNGTVTLNNVNVAVAGTYAIQVFYQNYSGSPQTMQVAIDGAQIPNGIVLDNRADSTGAQKLSGFVQVSAGAHTITFTGGSAQIDEIYLIQRTVSVPGFGNGLPDAFELAQNYPNPFNPATTISFALGKTSNVRLMVYNILGQRVATLVNNRMDAGTHTIQFDARNLASGVYFYRLEADKFVSSKKMMLLK